MVKKTIENIVTNKPYLWSRWEGVKLANSLLSNIPSNGPVSGVRDFLKVQMPTPITFLIAQIYSKKCKDLTKFYL